jgi:monoamine oxidase
LNTDVIVVGGGLSGLVAAFELQQAGRSVVVLEAAVQLGGRVQSLRHPSSKSYLGDLGPTWVWPDSQPIIRDWLSRLELKTYPQFDHGDTVIEQTADTPPMRYSTRGMYGSERISGGSTALVEALTIKLRPESISVCTRVTSVAFQRDHVEITTDNPGLPRLFAKHAIIAIPLRVAARSITWTPNLSAKLLQAMQATPTWMAQHAKALAVYDKAFWRGSGLSGRIASRVGPLVEAHDHSGPDGAPGAIFGFLGIPHRVRMKVGEQINNLVIAQLVRCFGQEAAEVRHFQIQDWAESDLICTDEDRHGPPTHPDVAPDILRQPFADGRIRFAVAELSTSSPGLIDGAFDIGTTVAADTIKHA